MKYYISPVVTSCIAPVKPIIKDKRQPCERMPETSLDICECPYEGFLINACGTKIYFTGNIRIIIIIYKFEILNLPENKNHRHAKENTDQKITLTI